MNYQVSARGRVDLIVTASVMRVCRRNKNFSANTVSLSLPS